MFVRSEGYSGGLFHFGDVKFHVLAIGFVVFMVHLATIPINGTGINPARSFGDAVINNQEKSGMTSCISSVHLESYCYQGFGILPQQPYKLKKMMEMVVLLLLLLLSI